MERLQKIIAARGYCSRRQAEKLILDGNVKVDNKVVMKLGEKFNEDAVIHIKNKQLFVTKEMVYYLFNKPRMVVTTMRDPKERKTVADFFKDLPIRVLPVGRLDYDVSGALIMTNDGNLINFITHPKYQFRKTYQALCQGQVEKTQIKQLINGVMIDENYLTKALYANLIKYNKEEDESIIELTIAEGRKHHVKKMLIAANIFLKKLKRSQIEFLEIKDIKVGEYRPLKPHEVKQLYGLYNSVKL